MLQMLTHPVKHCAETMKQILSIGVAFILVLPLSASFSTARPTEKIINTTYKNIEKDHTVFYLMYHYYSA